MAVRVTLVKSKIGHKHEHRGTLRPAKRQQSMAGVVLAG